MSSMDTLFFSSVHFFFILDYLNISLKLGGIVSSVKLKNGYVDFKMLPTPLLTKGGISKGVQF